jgi:hypothetical protein
LIKWHLSNEHMVLGMCDAQKQTSVSVMLGVVMTRQRQRVDASRQTRVASAGSGSFAQILPWPPQRPIETLPSFLDRCVAAFEHIGCLADQQLDRGCGLLNWRRVVELHIRALGKRSPMNLPIACPAAFGAHVKSGGRRARPKRHKGVAVQSPPPISSLPITGP